MKLFKSKNCWLSKIKFLKLQITGLMHKLDLYHLGQHHDRIIDSVNLTINRHNEFVWSIKQIFGFYKQDVQKKEKERERKEKIYASIQMKTNRILKITNHNREIII